MVCEIELSHIVENNRNPYLMCEKTLYILVTLANSEDTDEMPPDVIFHKCLHSVCYQRQVQSSEKEIKILF